MLTHKRAYHYNGSVHCCTVTVNSSDNLLSIPINRNKKKNWHTNTDATHNPLTHFKYKQQQ